jgi:hypothetical protein
MSSAPGRRAAPGVTHALIKASTGAPPNRQKPGGHSQGTVRPATSWRPVEAVSNQAAHEMVAGTVVHRDGKVGRNRVEVV